MARIIRVSSRELKRQASELQGLNARFRRTVSELVDIEGRLNGMWEGEANVEFHKAFMHDQNEMIEFYDNTEKFVNALITIAGNYEEAERRNTQIAHERKY